MPSQRLRFSGWSAAQRLMAMPRCERKAAKSGLSAKLPRCAAHRQSDAPKTRGWQRCFGQSEQGIRPAMLIDCLAGEIPDFTNGGNSPQIIDVPVRAGHWREMMFQPSSQPARTERTTDVGVPSAGKVECAKFADSEGCRHGKIREQDVGTFARR